MNNANKKQKDKPTDTKARKGRVWGPKPEGTTCLQEAERERKREGETEKEERRNIEEKTDSYTDQERDMGREREGERERGRKNKYRGKDRQEHITMENSCTRTLTRIQVHELQEADDEQSTTWGVYVSVCVCMCVCVFCI